MTRSFLYPGDFFEAFLQHEDPRDALIEAWVPYDEDGNPKKGFEKPKRPDPPKDGVKRPRSEQKCLACGEPGGLPDGLCDQCGIAWLRVRSNRWLLTAHTTTETCVVCQRPCGRGLTLNELSKLWASRDGKPKKTDGWGAGIERNSSVIRDPESSTVCVGCAALWLTSSGTQKIGRIVWAPESDLFLCKQELPWWRITERPVLVYTIRTSGWKQNRLSFAEPSHDPSYVVVNVMRGAEAERPSQHPLPMVGDPDDFERQLAVAVEAVRAEIAGASSGKKRSRASVDAVLRKKLRELFLERAKAISGMMPADAPEARDQMMRFAFPSA